MKKLFSRLMVFIFGEDKAEYVSPKELERSAPYTYGAFKHNDKVNMVLRGEKLLLIDRFSGEILLKWIKDGYEAEPQEIKDFERYLARRDEAEKRTSRPSMEENPKKEPSAEEMSERSVEVFSLN